MTPNNEGADARQPRLTPDFLTELFRNPLDPGTPTRPPAASAVKVRPGSGAR